MYALRHPGVLRNSWPPRERWCGLRGLARWSPATPAVAQGRVFVASGERVLCYEAQTGDLVWAYEHSGGVAALGPTCILAGVAAGRSWVRRW